MSSLNKVLEYNTLISSLKTTFFQCNNFFLFINFIHFESLLMQMQVRICTFVMRKQKS